MYLGSVWNAVATVGQQEKEGKETSAARGQAGTVHVGLVIPGARELRYLYTNSYETLGEDAGGGWMWGGASSPALPTSRVYGWFWKKMLATRSQQKPSQRVVYEGHGQGPDGTSCT